MTAKFQIALVASSLTVGGAERVLSIMANYWAAKGVDVALITFSLPDSDFYSLDSRVRRTSIEGLQPSSSLWAALKNNVTRALRLRSVVKDIQPNFIVSFLPRPNILTLLATLGLSVPVAVSERSNPSCQKLGKVWNFLRQRLYSSATAVVAQTPEAKGLLVAYVPEDRIHVIPNPVRQPSSLPDLILDSSIPQPFILAMGRLVPEKGFDLLLEAFAQSRSRQHASLVILGEGSERRNLESLAARLGIAERVHLQGLIQDPSIVSRHATLFVLSSRFEGFPNALLETMCLGIPVVSFDCPNGPKRIIEDEVNGLLVPPGDVHALSVAIDRLMDDESERRHLGANASMIADVFSVDNVMRKWDELIEACTRRDADEGFS